MFKNCIFFFWLEMYKIIEEEEIKEFYLIFVECMFENLFSFFD